MARYKIVETKLVKRYPFTNDDGEECFARLKHRVKKVVLRGYGDEHVLRWSEKSGFSWQFPATFRRPMLKDTNGKKIMFHRQGCDMHMEDRLAELEEVPGDKVEFAAEVNFRKYLKPRIGSDEMIDEIIEILTTEKGDG